MENRYDKYKDSGIAWIGEIPEHWKVKRLKNICSQTNIKENSKGNPLPYIGLENIESGSGKYIDTTSEVDGIANRFCKNNVLFGKLRPYLSKVYIAESDGICSTEFIVYDTKENDCHFIHKLLLSQSFIDVVNSSTYGAKMPRANSEFINNIYTQIPPIQEQQHISTYLDQKCGEIDELITLQEEMITKLQSYKQSVITEAVTKGLNKNVPLKDSGIEWIGEIPEHWICTVFKKFLSEPMQYGANEPAEECNYNDPRYIRITDIKDDGTLRDDTFKSLPLEKAKEFMLTKGNLLFARSGATVGKTFLYKEDYAACFAGYLIKARCNKNELLPNFIFYYTLSNAYQNWKNSIFIQSTIQNIGADKYSVMPIIVPPLSEQQSIANYLDQKCSEIDELISIKQQKIEKLKDYKKSLIFECVTGKRKV